MPSLLAGPPCSVSPTKPVTPPDPVTSSGRQVDVVGAPAPTKVERLVVEDDLEAGVVDRADDGVAVVVGVEDLVEAPLRDRDVAAGDAPRRPPRRPRWCSRRRDGIVAVLPSKPSVMVSPSASKPRSETVCTSTIVVGVAWYGRRPRRWCGRRSRGRCAAAGRPAADAGVGHHRGARAGLDRGLGDVVAAVAVGAVEGVVAAELVADLVGDVVDGEEVALRLGQAGAAAALVVAADDAEVGDATAVLAEGDVADVVVGGADQLAEDGAVLAERQDAAEVEIAGMSSSGAPLSSTSKHGAAPHGPSAPVASASVSRLSLSVSLTRRSSVREVVVVDLVDPVDQGDLLGQHVGGAEVGGVGRVGGQREPVEVALDGWPASGSLSRGPRLRRRCRAARSTSPSWRRFSGCRQVDGAVAEVRGGAAAVVGRVDVPVAPCHRACARRRGSPSG